MPSRRRASLAAIALLFVTGCAHEPASHRFVRDDQADTAAEAITAFARPDSPRDSARRGLLTGRTIEVSLISDIRLKPGEVVLTFDDGPVPGRTDSILDTLDRYGAKATFLMVGQMAQNHPETARKVARRGHSIGSHTWGHPDLNRMSFDRAVAEIRRGEAEINAAGAGPIKFFRFPYLSGNGPLRQHLADRGIVVLDVDIDSKDYFQTGPAQVSARTISTLHKRRSGIILFHDLHRRTASALPGFLDQLARDGYKVVRLTPAPPPLFAAARLN